MRLISWNVNGRYTVVHEQARAILARGPDVVALQEVRSTAAPRLIEALRQGGLRHVCTGLDSVGERTPDPYYASPVAGCPAAAGAPSILLSLPLVSRAVWQKIALFFSPLPAAGQVHWTAARYAS
jgi:hypothetical protein